MSVNRYEFEDYGTNEDDGRYVTYEDYAALEQKPAESQREFRAADATIENLQMQVEKLAAENAGLNKFIKADCWVWDDKNEEYIDAADCMPETPATAEILAEVLAQGVESAINTVIAMMNHQHPVTSKAIDIMRVHAYQLRKGVQS